MKAPLKTCPKCKQETTRLVLHDRKAHRKARQTASIRPPYVRGHKRQGKLKV